jgi:hypothetical protein
MVLSDLDATNFELEQAVLEESLGSSKSRDDVGTRKQQALPRNASRRRRSSPLSLPESSVVADVAMAPSVAAAAASSAASYDLSPPWPPSGDEYPAVIQELVMNGFELRKVIHAYELVGDNFDDLLLFLMSSVTNNI